MSLEALLAVAIPVGGAMIGWVLTVENRLSAVTKLTEKIDRLVDLLLERELNHAQAHLQSGSHPSQSVDRSSPQPH